MSAGVTAAAGSAATAAAEVEAGRVLARADVEAGTKGTAAERGVGGAIAGSMAAPVPAAVSEGGPTDEGEPSDVVPMSTIITGRCLSLLEDLLCAEGMAEVTGAPVNAAPFLGGIATALLSLNAFSGCCRS
jgi:hypothetical protein